MTAISKTAAGLSLVSSIHDIHKTALIYSNNAYAKTAANTVIRKSLNYQKANRISYKDTQRKNWLNEGSFLHSTREVLARIKGYCVGFAKTSIRYIPNFLAAGVAMLSKKTKIANIAAITLGGIEAWDFVKNSLGSGQRKDYLG